MIDLSAFELFQQNIKPLGETSKDTANGQYLISSNIQAISFDDVKTKYTASLHISDEKACSVDALIQCGETTLMVEFKNGKVSSSEIKNKIWDSLLIFSDITGKLVSDTRLEMDFFLVYNKERNPLNHQEQKMIAESEARDALVNSILRVAGKELIRFQLDNFELYFRKVHTYTAEQFEDYLTKHFPA